MHVNRDRLDPNLCVCADSRSNCRPALLLLSIAALLTLHSCFRSDPSPADDIIGKKTSASSVWAPLLCPTWGESRAVDVSTTKWQALKFIAPTHYENHTYRPWRMLFNQNVRYVGLRFSYFDVENGYDYLDVAHATGTTRFSGRSSADPNYPQLNQFLGPYQPFGSGWDPAYLNLTWYTDESINFTGYRIDALNIYCRSSSQTPVNTLEVEQNYPHHGYLLGDNDVIYVKVRQPDGPAPISWTV